MTLIILFTVSYTPITSVTRRVIQLLIQCQWVMCLLFGDIHLSELKKLDKLCDRVDAKLTITKSPVIDHRQLSISSLDIIRRPVNRVLSQM